MDKVPRVEEQMSPKKKGAVLAAVAAAAVGGAVLFAYLPQSCIARDDGGEDPIRFWKECKTPLGLQITVPHQSESATRFTYRPGPTSPNYMPVFTSTVLGALAAATVTYVATQLRWRGFEAILGIEQ